MLGPTDESHIIGCIEYWDIERRRFPAYDQCAVIVANDLTSRFLNALSLLAGTLPLIAIQLRALQIGSQVILDFTTVLDQPSLRRHDTSETKQAPADHNYWVARCPASIIQIADDVLTIINKHTRVQYHPNYNRHYIGLSDGIHSRNFIHFRPRRKHIRLLMPNTWTTQNARALDEAGLEAEQNKNRLIYNLTAADLKSHTAVVTA